jgi:hypothetical protein
MPGRARLAIAAMAVAAAALAWTQVPKLMHPGAQTSSTAGRGGCQQSGDAAQACAVPSTGVGALDPSPGQSASASAAPAPPAPTGTGPSPSHPSGTTAASRYDWGTPYSTENFNGTSLNDNWGAYDGAGSGGNGVRSPKQVTVGGGILKITGLADGTTGGVYWKGSLKYGRWEIRARFPAGCACYHPVVLLWPANDDWPTGGEVDYAEVFDGPRRTLRFFLHYGPDDKRLTATRDMDLTQWHTYAVEWTPDHITGYVDGQPYFHTSDPAAQPPGRMFQTIQLDWYPQRETGGGTMEVDWARKYKL